MTLLKLFCIFGWIAVASGIGLVIAPPRESLELLWSLVICAWLGIAGTALIAAVIIFRMVAK